KLKLNFCAYFLFTFKKYVLTMGTISKFKSVLGVLIFMPSLLMTIMLILLLGIGSQWIAWRYRMPAIVIMSITGLVVGPFLGIINPEEAFGDLYDPIISVAVAIILFEG